MHLELHPFEFKMLLVLLIAAAPAGEQDNKPYFSLIYLFPS